MIKYWNEEDMKRQEHTEGGEGYITENGNLF